MLFTESSHTAVSRQLKQQEESLLSAAATQQPLRPAGCKPYEKSISKKKIVVRVYCSLTCRLRSPLPGLIVASGALLPVGLLPAAVAATVLPYAMSGGPDKNSTSCATPEKAGAALPLLPWGLAGPLLLLLLLPGKFGSV
jgi:hypothetical protein